MQRGQNFNFDLGKSGLVELAVERAIRPPPGFERNVRYAPMLKCIEVSSMNCRENGVVVRNGNLQW